MDGLNVNWVFFSELRNYRTENDISFHAGSIHGALKTGEQSTDWKLKQVLKAFIKFRVTRQLGEMITLM